ncbi:ABC transporter permease [Clostridium grantii]|uniref:Putative aldouronate transport system permease protein n=1 Tax=Clostridium grantii DSM 8605 TaxID=1121316 RepID=A0A1M5WKG7_9CLOT|nr:ABC transporter permease subunit [Clostridium grantii]SHH87932.1 putative aldouronate transport system permease protein [Clostridium grantii DSM 8605]
MKESRGMALKYENNKFLKALKKDYQLYLLILPAVIYFLIFHYAPMYGIQIAFKDFSPVKGITGSPWVGFKYFERFFNSYQFWILLKNTLGISVFQLVAGFPIPIILALLLNQVKQKHFKKLVQTVTYIPHFISVVVLVGMLNVFLSPTTGLVNNLLHLLGKDPIYFLGVPEYFKSIFVFSGVWQNAGWGSIIYLAALAGVSPELYEAAKVDGATKLQIIKNVDIPSIMPTIIILLIMNLGQIMNLGFQKAFLLQNSLNAGASEIIQTYMYKIGLLQMQFEYSTAISLFNTLINIILLVSANRLSKKFTENSLW